MLYLLWSRFLTVGLTRHVCSSNPCTLTMLQFDAHEKGVYSMSKNLVNVTWGILMISGKKCKPQLWLGAVQKLDHSSVTFRILWPLASDNHRGPRWPTVTTNYTNHRPRNYVCDFKKKARASFWTIPYIYHNQLWWPSAAKLCLWFQEKGAS